jgi:hypothetical protein
MIVHAHKAIIIAILCMSAFYFSAFATSEYPERAEESYLTCHVDAIMGAAIQFIQKSCTLFKNNIDIQSVSASRKVELVYHDPREKPISYHLT